MFKLMYPVIIVCTFATNNLAAYTQKVLIEEFTATSCGFCPPGSYDLDQLTKKSANYILVSHHAPYDDNMSTPFAVSLSNDFKAYSMPGALVNRTSTGGKAEYIVANVPSAAANLAKVTPIAGVLFNKLAWDPTTRRVSGEISVEFATESTGEFRVGLIVVENNVVGGSGRQTMIEGVVKSGGESSGYDQSTYDEDWIKSHYPTLTIKNGEVIGYAHYNVARAMPFGAYGKVGSIPSPARASTPYLTSFEYTIPASYDPTLLGRPANLNEMNLVAFVAKYATTVASRTIVNAEKVELRNIPTSIINVKPDRRSSISMTKMMVVSSAVDVWLQVEQSGLYQVQQITGQGAIVNSFSVGLTKGWNNIPSAKFHTSGSKDLFIIQYHMLRGK